MFDQHPLLQNWACLYYCMAHGARAWATTHQMMRDNSRECPFGFHIKMVAYLRCLSARVGVPGLSSDKGVAQLD